MEIENLAADAEEFTANAFLLDGEVLVDAGGAPCILQRLAGVELTDIVITHGHHDHIRNLHDLWQQQRATVHVFDDTEYPMDVHVVADGDVLELAGHRFEVLHTPGHRDDHICLFNADDGVLFSGDLIFPNGSFGRTDLEQGDRDRLIASIERVAERDVQALYPGHEEPTTDRVNDQIQQSLEHAKQREPKYG